MNGILQCLRSVKRDTVYAGLILLYLLLTYGDALANGFCLDDWGLIVYAQPEAFLSYCQLDPAQWASTDANRLIYFRPMTHILYWFELALFGKDLLSYHVFSLGLFAVLAWMLFTSLRDFLANERLAFLSTLLFMVHPLSGVLVNYLTASALTLWFILMIGGLRAAFEHSRRQATGYSGRALLCFALALVTHEMAIMFPFYWAALLWSVERKSVKEIFRSLIPYFVLLGLFVILRTKLVSVGDIVTSGSVSVGGVISLFFAFLRNFFLLDPVVLMRSATDMPGLVLGAGVGFVSLVFIAVLWRTGRSTAALGLLWVICAFLPVFLMSKARTNLGLVIQPQWMLFATLGLSILIAVMIEAISRHQKPRIALALAVVVIAVCMAASRIGTVKIWGDEKNHCLTMLGFNPRMKLVNFWAGNAALREGNLTGARDHFLASLENKSSDWRIWTNLGYIALEAGDTDKAIEYSRRALALNPDAATARFNLEAAQKR